MTALLIPLDCHGGCGRTVALPVSAELLIQLEAAGVTPDEIAQAIGKGQLAQRLLCQDCARSSVN